MKTFMRCFLVLVALGCCGVSNQAIAESDGGGGAARYDDSCINAAQVQQPACPDTRILDCKGNVIGVKECWGPKPGDDTGCRNAAQIQQPACPDTRILDCSGNVIGVKECINTPNEPGLNCPIYQLPLCKADEEVGYEDSGLVGCPKRPVCKPKTLPTECPIYQLPLCKADEVVGYEDSALVGCPQRPVCKPKVFGAECPVYANPQCRADQRVVTVDVPVQFQVSGCPTTMPVCAAKTETNDDARTPSNRCGSQQRFNATSGRCENTSTSCRPFLRFCQRGETPTQTCSCSPTKASELGPATCVPAPVCPDNRVLNCDATFMSNVRSCKVTLPQPEPSVTTVTTDTTVVTPLMRQMEQCLQEYKTEVTKLRNRFGGVAAGVAFPDVWNKNVWDSSIVQSQAWYQTWVQRCGDFFPGSGIGNNSGIYTGGTSGSDGPSGGAGGPM